MRKIIAMLVAGYMSLAFSVPMADAISSVKAAVKKGLANVSGNGAVPFAGIEWEGLMEGRADGRGRFKFKAPIPSDCEGELSDGDMTLFVPVNNCTPSVPPPPVGAPAPVPQTGQTASFATGDDRDVQAGVPSPTPRFTDNGDGTVTDNLTELVWLKNADCFGRRTWGQALSDANNLADPQCGLMDGSVAGDWYLPNVKELQSLIDFGNINPSLPTGHPFTALLSTAYLSSTTRAGLTSNAWNVSFSTGEVRNLAKNFSDPGIPVLPVRGGP